jgi:hypothetical protein
MGRIHGSSCWEDDPADTWQYGGHLSGSELGMKPKRVESE